MEPQTLECAHYKLRFQSIVDAAQVLVFPCDAQGTVDMDRLGECMRNRYLYARAVVGREFLRPAVLRCDDC